MLKKKNGLIIVKNSMAVVFFEKKISQAQLCLRFCMSFQDVLITIAGMISEKEVLENSAVLGMKPMSNRQIQYIIKFNKEVEPFINS